MKELTKPRLAFSFLLLLPAPPTIPAPPSSTADDPPPVYHLHEDYVASQQLLAGGETNATLPHFELNFGVIPNMQLHLVAPLGYVHAAGATHYGYADTEIGIKYRFVEESESCPQIGAFPLVEIPTGNEEKGLGNGKIQAFVPVWAQKSWGKLTTYGGGGFWYNPGPDRRNWGFAGWELQYDFSQALTLGGELYYQTADTRDGQSSDGFTFGGIVNLNEQNHLLFSIGHSLSGAGETSSYIAYQLTI